MNRLVIGTTNDFYPYNFKDNKTFDGYDIELCRDLANYYHIQAEFQSYKGVQDLMSAVKNNEVDLIVAGLAVTNKRRTLLDFIHPYAKFSSYSLLVDSQYQNLKNWEELDRPNIVIGVARDSASEDIGKTIFKKATVMTYNGETETAQAILKKEADALIRNQYWCKAFRMRHSDKVCILEPELGKPTSLGIAVKKHNDELTYKISSFLWKYMGTDVQRKVYNKWFDKIDTSLLASEL